MSEYKNYSQFSYPAILFAKLFPYVAPAALLLMVLFQMDWGQGLETAATVAVWCLITAVAFLGFQCLGIVPLALRVSPEGFAIQIWRQYRQYKWTELKSVRHHRWTGGVDLLLVRRRLLCRNLVKLSLSKPAAENLLKDIQTYAPAVKVIRGHFA